jgi:hypothetical protein
MSNNKQIFDEDINLVAIMGSKVRGKNLNLNLPRRTMHKSHTKFTYPSKLQLVLGMENFVMCKIVEQTSKPQG